MKYYAILAGRKPGIYTTWAEAQTQVSGFSGAKFQSFHTEKEAKEYLGHNGDIFEQPVVLKETDYLSDDYDLVYFVDGSYNPATNVVGAGLVVVSNNKIINEIPYTLDNDSNMRNVWGEIWAAMRAVDNARLIGKKKIAIVYDYQGIESWATGAWRAKNDYTSGYKTYMAQAARDLKFDFYKVKSHTGVEFNEAVDIVAKSGAGVN